MVRAERLAEPPSRLALADLAVALATEAMEARLADALPTGPGWQFEPKWDGFRCLAFRAGEEVDIRAKSGKSLARYFPEMAAALGAATVDRFVIDGELVIPAGDTLSFEALQLRLHPAGSRVRRLAAETPSLLVLFDCLLDDEGESLMEAPLAQRRERLERLHSRLGPRGPFRLTPYTLVRKEALAWLDRAGGAIDGVVAKRRDGRYAAGRREMVKVKRMRTADCVVGGFRYETGGSLVGSLLLGLYDEAGRLNHVGFTSGISDADRAELTRRLEALIEPPGFTGDAPGGPSRWSTQRTGEWRPVKPVLVVEVRYDHITGGRMRHGAALVRWRPDKAPEQCRTDQLRPEARPSRLIAKAIG